MLNEVKRRLNIYRRYPYWKRAGCIYIHVPKAAGTSINKAIYGRTLGHYYSCEIRNAFPSLYEELFTFSFVRNPWSRVLSAYNFVCRGGTETMGVHNSKMYHIPEFDSFERFLFDWLMNQDLSTADFVFRPQAPFVYDDEEVMVDYLGKVEELDSGLEVISAKTGKNFRVGKVNSTASDGFDYREYYKSNEAIELVGELYKQDVRKFKYEFGG